MHRLVQITDLNLSLPHKICFEGFSARVSFGDRIGIIGRNGVGKSSLLKAVAKGNSDILSAYIPQIIDDFCSLSGGERFNKMLSGALGKNPDMLLLDEPTNHLDLHNRKNLMRRLQSYCGTLMVVTHDKELLRNCVHILWHIDDGRVTIFHGNYDDYVNEVQWKRHSIFRQIKLLEREKKSIREDLTREQERIAKSKLSGKKKVKAKKWMKSVGDLKAMKAEKAHGNKLKNIDDKRQELSDQLLQIRIPETLIPKFNLSHQDISNKTLISIVDGMVGYESKIILQNINLSVMSRERVAIVGDNGSGKTTLVKAILGKHGSKYPRNKVYANGLSVVAMEKLQGDSIIKSGDWNLPNPEDIGYLDQHYGTIDLEKNAVEIISEANPLWSYAEIRRHLNNFLFRKNEEVNAMAKTLSGGERLRLALAQIAANSTKILILDEITNNIDMETRDHVVEILQEYPAAMIVISHDKDFLSEIKIEKYYGT